MEEEGCQIELRAIYANTPDDATAAWVRHESVSKGNCSSVCCDTGS